jgi:hypothetical protein
MMASGHWPRKEMMMKALEIIEKHGLDARVAIDALINFYDSEFVCEQLCEVIDKCGNVADFAEFMDDSFHGSTGSETTDDCSGKRCPDLSHDASDEEFLRQLDGMELPSHHGFDRLAFFKWKAAVMQRIFEHPAMQADAEPMAVPDFDGLHWKDDYLSGMTVDEAVKRADAEFNRGGW